MMNSVGASNPASRTSVASWSSRDNNRRSSGVVALATARTGVEPGEVVTARVDFLMANDITAPLAIEAFESIGAQRISTSPAMEDVQGRQIVCQNPTVQGVKDTARSQVEMMRYRAAIWPSKSAMSK